MPSASTRAPVFAPRPGSRRTLSGSRTCIDLRRRDHAQPVGLVQIGGDLRDQLVGTDADGRGEPGGLANSLLDEPRNCGGLLQGRGACRNVEIGLIERQAFNQRRDVAKYREDLLRDFLVPLHSRPNADGVGTEAPRCMHRQRGAHTELAHLVACRGYYPAIAGPSDDDGLPLELRIVVLLDGCIERIHVHMQYGPSDAGHRVVALVRDGDCRSSSTSPADCAERDSDRPAAAAGCACRVSARARPRSDLCRNARSCRVAGSGMPLSPGASASMSR